MTAQYNQVPRHVRNFIEGILCDSDIAAPVQCRLITKTGETDISYFSLRDRITKTIGITSLHLSDFIKYKIMSETWTGWFCDLSLNRVDGPAYIDEHCEDWWHFNMRHRLDGPARNRHDHWYVYGQPLINFHHVADSNNYEQAIMEYLKNNPKLYKEVRKIAQANNWASKTTWNTIDLCQKFANHSD